MKIRRKISLGFIIIGSILFLSSAIAVFEFSRMRKSVTWLMTANINSINTSRKLMELTEEYNFILLGRVIIDSSIKAEEILYDERFDEYIASIRKNFTNDSERATADSLAHSYSRYLAVISNSRTVMQQDYQVRKEWYEKSLTPVYTDLRKYKKDLGMLTQTALAQNSIELQEGYYRSIMPGIIAVGVGIVLVLLFHFFINSFVITPLLKISKGIKNYREFRKSYTVTLDNDDELDDMNGEVRSIIEENKKLKSS